LIKYLDHITRAMLRAEPEARFVFGDNVDRIGRGGQAAHMRGELNAIGVATKWAPENVERAFFDDSYPCFYHLARDLNKVEWEVWDGRTVYLPKAGLGTGLAQLPERAPKLHHYLVTRIKNMPGEPCPWDGGGR
jgi:hypothetical protein